MSADHASRRSLQDLGSLLEVETLIADLSSRFIDLPPDEVDREVEDGRRRVCEPLGIDLSVLWQWSAAAPGVIVPTHAYCTEEGLRPTDPIRQEQYPWSIEQVLAGRLITASSIEDLPAEAAVDRETCRRFGIRSALCIPLSVGGEPPVGALGFNTLRTQHDWPDPLVKRLQVVAQVFTNALVRRRHELSLQESEARLREAADLVGLGFYEVDLGARAVFVDDRFAEVCGIPPDVPRGLGILEFWMEHLHPDDRELVLERRQELHEGRRERLTMEYRYLHPTRGETWIHHVARVGRRDASGNKTFGVLRDITERRRREEAHVEFVGQSPAIRKVLSLVEQVAPTDSAVLLRGETGSGKELVARAIHRLSARRDRLMVKVNCAGGQHTRRHHLHRRDGREAPSSPRRRRRWPPGAGSGSLAGRASFRRPERSSPVFAFLWMIPERAARRIGARR